VTRRIAVMLCATLLLAGCTGDGDRGLGDDDASGAPQAWLTLSPMPTPRTEVAAAAADGRIVVAGGFDAAGDTVATVEVYDVEADEWTEGPDLPLAVNHAMAASDGERVYVLGGYNREGTPTSGAYVLEGGTWTSLEEMPEPRAAGGAVFAADGLFVAGGIGPTGLAGSTMVLALATGRWGPAAGLNEPREHLGVTALGDLVYAVGGRVNGLAGNLATVERLDPATGVWEELPGMPTARGGTAAAAGGGLVISAGGEQESGTFAEVEAYDPDARSWQALPELPTPRHGLGVVVSDETLYVIAGGPAPGLTVTGVVEALDLRTV
jgi:hypothetical protein